MDHHPDQPVWTYGYLRITAMLQMEGWRVNHKHVARIWRQDGY
jgi:hypothetical protein